MPHKIDMFNCRCNKHEEEAIGPETAMRFRKLADSRVKKIKAARSRP
jgi:hypothetical protein